MINIFKLGFVEFGVKDVNVMSTYYSDVMGLTLTDEDENGSVYFSSSSDHHNIVLNPNVDSGVYRFGLQYQSDNTIIEVAEYLKFNFGIVTELKINSKPGVSKLLEFTDPEGFIVQLYPHMEFKYPKFKEAGIVPNKIGHLSLRVTNPQRQIKFYEQLGFVNTDWIEDFFGFMTCNRDHHVLNFAKSDSVGLHHIAFEMRNYTHLIASLDFLRFKKIKIEWGPSRHGAGHNIACYHPDAEGNRNELFTDGDIYIKELDVFEPRPWHKDFPQKPKIWSSEECLSVWGVDFDKALV